MLIIPVLLRERQNSSEFQASLSYQARPLTPPLSGLIYAHGMQIFSAELVLSISSILSRLKNLPILYKMTVIKKEAIIYLRYSPKTCPGGVLTLICGKMPRRLAARPLSTGLCQQGRDRCCATFGRKSGKRWLDWLLSFEYWWNITQRRLLSPRGTPIAGSLHYCWDKLRSFHSSSLSPPFLIISGYGFLSAWQGYSVYTQVSACCLTGHCFSMNLYHRAWKY